MEERRERPGPAEHPPGGNVPPQESIPGGTDPAVAGAAHDPMADGDDLSRPPWGSYGPGYAPAAIGQLRTFGSGLLCGWGSANDGGEFG